jgi:hypothetical protein
MIPYHAHQEMSRDQNHFFWRQLSPDCRARSLASLRKRRPALFDFLDSRMKQVMILQITGFAGE